MKLVLIVLVVLVVLVVLIVLVVLDLDEFDLVLFFSSDIGIPGIQKKERQKSLKML